MTAPARRRSPGRWPPARDDRGSAPVELVILTFVSFLFVAMIIFAGRLNVGTAHTEAAARSAARAISVSRNPGAAVDAAEAEAARIVREGSAMCADMDFDPRFQGDRVTVTVWCDVDLSEATLLEVPGSLQVSGSATEAIDRYREAPAP